MSETCPAILSKQRLHIVRLVDPSVQELEVLSTYDHEAFGSTGLRSSDIAFMARAGMVFLAQIDGETVGGCQLMRMVEEPTMMWVVGFYIRPQWRRQGLGRTFLAGVLELISTLSCSGLMLTVDAGNAAASGLYRSFGFRLLESMPEFYGRGEDRHLMRLDLRET